MSCMIAHVLAASLALSPGTGHAAAGLAAAATSFGTLIAQPPNINSSRDPHAALQPLQRRLSMTSRPDVREAAERELRALTNQRFYPAMIDVLGDIDDDVRTLLTRHFAGRDDPGQGALLLIALQSDHKAWSDQAALHLTTPVGYRVRNMLSSALRSQDEPLIERAALLIDALDLTDLMPALLHAQFRPTRHRVTAEDPWAILREQSFIVGGSGRVGPHSIIRRAFPGGVRGLLGDNDIYPIPRVRQGEIVSPLPQTPAPLRRTIIRDVLLSLAERALGRKVRDPGAHAHAWYTWYLNDFLPELQQVRKESEHHQRMLQRIDEAFDAVEGF